MSNPKPKKIHQDDFEATERAVSLVLDCFELNDIPDDIAYSACGLIVIHAIRNAPKYRYDEIKKSFIEALESYEI